MSCVILGTKRMDMIESFFNLREIDYIFIDRIEAVKKTQVGSNIILYPKEEYIRKTIEYIINNDVKFVISNSSTDKEALNDSLIGEYIVQSNIHYIGHRRELIELFSNKFHTKELISKLGFNTPNYKFFKKSSDLYCLKDNFSFPVLIKKVDESSGHGIGIIKDDKDLDIYMSVNIGNDFLVEKFIDGIELSIECFRSADLSITLPPIYKSNTTLSGIHALEKTRIFPLLLSESNEREIEKLCSSLLNVEGVNGWLDIDAIYHNGIISIIEVNPRFSGVSRLIGMAMKYNPYEISLLSYFREFNEDISLINGVSMEVPFTKNGPKESENIICSYRPHAEHSKGFFTISSINLTQIVDQLESFNDCNYLKKDIDNALLEIQKFKLLKSS